MNSENQEYEMSPSGGPDAHELEKLKHSWWWFLILGLLLALCGTVAIIYPFASSVSVVIVLGAMMMIGGLATVVSSFWTGNWSAFLLQLLVGILYIVAGIAVTDAPIQSTAMLTLLLSAFLIVVGLFRIVASLVIKFPQWGWALLNGCVTLLFGIVIYRHFPEAALWLIGTLVGVEMILNGWTWLMLAFALRSQIKD